MDEVYSSDYTRAMNLCPHFGECGGCATLDISYAEQIQDKHDEVSTLFGRDLEFVPSERPLYYRNRMDFAIGHGAAGLHRNWHTLVDLHDCRLLSPEAMPILRFVRDEVTRRRMTEYDRRELKGFFRYVVIREGKFTGLRLVNLVTSPGELPADLAESLLARFKIDGVAHVTTDSVADLSRGEVKQVWGRPSIEENLDGTFLAMGPNSFFQPNSFQACVLYRDIAMHLRPRARLLDLYCGVGSIGLYTGAIVTGVDNDAENIRLARDNARRNGRQADFFLRDAGQVEIGGHDAVVVDPPRSGLHPKLADRLNRLGPDQVIYVSCNPQTLQRDLRILDRYRVETLKGYDFCPHTYHIEMLCALARS